MLYFIESSPTLSDNGFILYINETCNKYYGDQERRYLVRYNTADDTYHFAENPRRFILEQPERGDDTEDGYIQSKVFLSTDGKYAYGQITAFGVDLGSIHNDYKILFSYNFETNEYKRLGDEDDSFVTIRDMTYDRKWLFYYTGDNKLKRLNVKTGKTGMVSDDINLVNVKENAWSSRGACVSTTTGDLYNKDLIDDNEVQVCHNDYINYNVMFSKNEQHIYFTVDDGEKKYLCVTNSIDANATYDTLGTYPVEFHDLMLIK